MKLFKYRSTPYFAVLWFLALWLLHRDVTSQSFLSKDAQIDINDGALLMRQDYLGFYMGQQKIGFSQFVLKEDSAESETKLPGKYYTFDSMLYLRIQALGFPIEVRAKQTGEVNEDLSMRTFSSDYQASGQRLYTLGVIDENGLNLTSVVDGNTSKQTIEVPNPIYHTEMIHLLIARDGLKVGTTQSYPVFDPLTMSKGSMTAKVESQEEVTLPDGNKASAFKVNVNYKGLNTVVWLDKDGGLIKEDTQVAGMAFTALRETREQATDLAFVSKEIQDQKTDPSAVSKPIDLIESSRIIPKTKIPNPEKVQRMEAKLVNVASGEIVLDNNTQFLISSQDDGIVVAFERVDYPALIEDVPNGKPPFNPDASLNEYLKDELLIQSSNEKIRQKALEITQNSENVWDAAEDIANWLYVNIRKEMRATIPSAVEILNSMRGDCNEHSTLFAALARSIGIPTKIAAGLVYQDDGFYYHAWNEVYINGIWIPVDATLNRIRMDAAHIKFAEGSIDSQADIVNLIGQIDVEILSFKEFG